MTDDKAELMISDMEDEEELSTGAKKEGGTKLKSNGNQKQRGGKRVS